MKGTYTKYLIFGVLGLFLLFLLISTFGGGSRATWALKYREAGTGPYDLYVLRELVESAPTVEEFTLVKDSLRGNLPSTNEGASYLFVGEGMYLDSVDVDALLAFVDAGNSAFIASSSLPQDLMFYVYYDECPDAYWNDYETYPDTLLSQNFEHPDLQRTEPYTYWYKKREDQNFFGWSYFNDAHFCDEPYSFLPLGSINDNWVNFASIRYGEGTFYFNANPLAFTNYFLRDTSGLSYATSALGYLPKGDIYWDGFSRVPEYVSRARNQTRRDNNPFNDESPLKYVLSQPPLAWAWYLGLGLALLYLAFRAKRRQRIIPVLPKNENTSLAFIQTMGRIGFLQQNHTRVAQQQQRLFLHFVRDRYHISTKAMDQNFRHTLALKSGVAEAQIDKLLLYFQNINNTKRVTEQGLVNFHQELELFYEACR